MLLKILILAIIQGVAELLPVSSSAHVIVAEKLMGFDPISPEMTLLLVMLHTGTMFAVIIFFWSSWKERFFSSRQSSINSMKLIIAATFFTGVVGFLIKLGVEKCIFKNVPHAEIELLFGNLGLMSAALGAVGILIILAGLKERGTLIKNEESSFDLKTSCLIGAVQGFCLPFRGFSRSGATISTGLLLGLGKRKVEDFSFALAVVLTPPVILREVFRLLKAQHSATHDLSNMAGLFFPGLIGMSLSFVSGFLALKWLSNWLDRGRWYFFGIYC